MIHLQNNPLIELPFEQFRPLRLRRVLCYSHCADVLAVTVVGESVGDDPGGDAVVSGLVLLVFTSDAVGMEAAIGLENIG